MYRQCQKSSLSARSDLSNHSLLSASSSASPRPTPSFPSPSVYGNLLSPADTPHKRNRFKTLYFEPSIRDSGISLSTPTLGPRFLSPCTPPCCPVPGIPIAEEALVKSELDFLVDELAARYDCCDSRDLESLVPDRCDSPTLGYSSTTMASRSRVPLPMRGQNDNSSRGHISALPGASHLNSPVDLSLRELATTSKPSNVEKTKSRAKPTINPSSPLLNLPHVFRRLAITDPYINGQPIRFLSQDYVAGANSLQVGSCTFMNLAYGADVECGLRVEPNFPEKASASQTVILQIVQRVVRVVDGSSVWLLCSEVDVSSSFTALVRHEVAFAASARASNPGTSKQKQRSGDNDDIWVSLAQQLETSSYGPSTTRLPTSSSSAIKTKSATTPALSDLLSLLTELRFLHRQFFILSPKKSKLGEAELSIPYLSSSLHTSLLSLPSASPPSQPPRQKDSLRGFDSSIYTPILAPNTPLAIFLATATLAAKTWLGERQPQPSTPTILRQVLSLPPMGKSKEEKDEQIGIYGVRVAEFWGEGRQGLGCWVCFLVPKGVEKEL